MDHTSRLGAVVIVAFGWIGLGCGGGDPAPADAPPETPDTEAPDTVGPATDEPMDSAWALEFALAGRATPMTARAELKINQGEIPVHLAITGRTTGTDFVMIDLTFEGIEAALGPHHVQFSLPQGGAHVANSSLDDTWYYSQGGEIDVSVDGDGSIEGNFRIALARGTLGNPGEPVVFAPSAEVTPLEGSFSGDWVLNCHSRLMGHQTLIFGGEYCEGLDLAE
jgi:hypothetical protein